MREFLLAAAISGLILSVALMVGIGVPSAPDSGTPVYAQGQVMRGHALVLDRLRQALGPARRATIRGNASRTSWRTGSAG